jgi:DNA-binding MarR family transcriptional regulator
LSEFKKQSKKNISPKLKVKLNFKSVRSNIIPILKLLAAGRYSAEIARMLKMSKPHVAYYTKILEKTGFIRREKRSDIVCYEVTVKGKEFLDRSEGVLVGSKIWRLHNAKYRYGLLHDGAWPSEWRKVEMTNWTALLGLEAGVRVQHTPSSIIISVDALYGENPVTLVDAARSIADRTAKTLMLKYKCLLAEGSICRKPHIAIEDSVAEFVSRYFEISTSESKIDRSEGLGEIDFFGVKNAVDYLRLPERVTEMADKLEVMSCDMTEIKATLEQLIGILGKDIEEHPFETVIKSLEDKQQSS